MASDASVREATLNDLEPIRLLHHDLCRHEYEKSFDPDIDVAYSFSEHFTTYLEDRIAEDGGLAVVALLDENPVAYLLGSIDEGKDTSSAKLESMFTVPAHRRKGIGRMLAARFLEWANSKNATRTTVAVAPGNEAAVALYRTLGFKAHTIILEIRNP